MGVKKRTGNNEREVEGNGDSNRNMKYGQYEQHETHDLVLTVLVVFVNVTQTRITREEVTLTEELLPSVGLWACL